MYIRSPFTAMIFARYSVLLLLLLGIFISCNKNKKVAEISEADKVLAEEKKMESVGLVRAVVVDYSGKEDGCGFLIKTESETVLQPLNIPEELRVDGQSVWLSFTPSRRQQGACKLGTPITISNIETRKIKP